MAKELVDIRDYWMNPIDISIFFEYYANFCGENKDVEIFGLELPDVYGQCMGYMIRYGREFILHNKTLNFLNELVDYAALRAEGKISDSDYSKNYPVMLSNIESNHDDFEIYKYCFRSFLSLLDGRLGDDSFSDIIVALEGVAGFVDEINCDKIMIVPYHEVLIDLLGNILVGHILHFAKNKMSTRGEGAGWSFVDIFIDIVSQRQN